MIQRTFDLTWRSSRRLGGNAQHKRACGRFGSFIGYIFRGHGKKAHGYIFRGLTSERDRLHFSGFTATFLAVISYIFRGTRLRFSGFIRARSATFLGVHQSAIGYIFRGLVARLTLPSPAPLALTSS
jgi:hypothetical protein